jgi:hypothetical protein
MIDDDDDGDEDEDGAGGREDYSFRNSVEELM